jgi:hypothetical protein
MVGKKIRGFTLGVFSPKPNPQAGGPPPVGCTRLLIQYILSYPPYLETVSSIRNLRTRHAVVTGDTLNLGLQLPRLRKHKFLLAVERCCDDAQFDSFTSHQENKTRKLARPPPLHCVIFSSALKCPLQCTSSTKAMFLFRLAHVILRNLSRQRSLH